MYNVIIRMNGNDHIVNPDVTYKEALESSFDYMAQMKESFMAGNVRIEMAKSVITAHSSQIFETGVKEGEV